MAPQIRIAPLFAAIDGATAPLGVFVGGQLLRGVRSVVDVGGDIVVVLDRDQVAFPFPTPAPPPPGTPLPTDGAA